jgi:hypothetical protein
MKGNIVETPYKNMRLSEARAILQNMEDHSHKDIDAAFEMLIYSNNLEDQKLCTEAVGRLWEPPKANYPVVMVIAASMTVILITLSVMLVEVLL